MNEIDEEIKILEEQIKKTPSDDTLHYKLGNLHRKTGNWKAAIKCYLTASELNPASPAAEACKSIMDILEFYNKDLYNP
ncbi:MAG: tetratricopeptide repeat protein [Bacteroidetes bacterium]|uniref:Tetratricopeptide repeat protein n=1 Tax=Candidatus Caccoplasma merdipullorum TaxID=2840718 RepID=A0A9D9H6J1_9BACT|nr:tetratricopeptide repeat protein [Candidatus Caccoplasma merdipullorum]